MEGLIRVFVFQITHVAVRVVGWDQSIVEHLLVMQEMVVLVWVSVLQITLVLVFQDGKVMLIVLPSVATV